jgi:hypothetical protein
MIKNNGKPRTYFSCDKELRKELNKRLEIKEDNKEFFKVS